MMKNYYDKVQIGMVEKGMFSAMSFLLYFLRGGMKNGEGV